MQTLHSSDARFCLATECVSLIIPVIMTMVDPEKERQRLTELYARMSEGELLKVCDDPSH